MKKSKLKINVGSMFSGKSSKLQRQGNVHLIAEQSVIYLKPAKDNRYADNKIVTHDGSAVGCINVYDTIMLPEVLQADVILIDEVQFINYDKFIEEIYELLKAGKIIYCSGLDNDFLGNSFPTTNKLMAMADEVNKCKAVCEVCKGEGMITAKRKGNTNTSTFQLGSKKDYIPLCRDCYFKYTGYSN